MLLSIKVFKMINFIAWVWLKGVEIVKLFTKKLISYTEILVKKEQKPNKSNILLQSR